MANTNPYFPTSIDVGKLIDCLKHDRELAMAGGAELVRLMLNQVQEAARAWDGGRSRGRAIAEGTPYWTTINLLENWLANDTAARKMSKRELRRLQRENQGFVYVVSAGPDMVKIGFTTNMASRLKSLGTGSPAEIEVLVLVAGTMVDERDLHQRFSKDHVRGEWFRLSAEVRAFIESEKVKATGGQAG